MRTGNIYAKKTFREAADYEDQKKNYKNLEIFPKELLSNLAITPNKDQFNDKEKTICFIPGMCSLQDLLNYEDFKFNKDQIVHIWVLQYQ